VAAYALSDIAEELYLEVEAGSMGKPNQQVEVNNWKQMLPLLIQMGGIKPLWLAKETLRRLDDRMDLTDAVAEGIPSIASMNQTAQPAAAGAEQNPAAQGARGANRTHRRGRLRSSQAVTHRWETTAFKAFCTKSLDIVTYTRYNYHRKT
jgi:hypothetical protein